jgi:purine-binding chemotaxis protein CheW
MATTKGEVTTGAGATHLLILALEARTVALPLERVLELVRMVAIARLPEAPAWVPGVVNLRGTTIPVVDLRGRFGLPGADYGLDTRIVICTTGSRLVGVVADAAVEIAAVAEDDVERPDELVGDDHPLVSVARIDGSLVPVLDVDRVCAGTELLELPDEPFPSDPVPIASAQAKTKGS